MTNDQTARIVDTDRIEDLKDVRSEQRYLARFSGTVIIDRKPLAVEIADISCVGACVRGADLPKRGEEIVLLAENLEVVGTVVWSDDTACGINFHKPIAPLAVIGSNPYLPNFNTLTKAVAMRG
ncbi:PilZ domain-containing protein [Sphingomonas sp. PAMC 26605]|uniref:PilZ domain-containing protein n=1 Tax=Sphingomonas sp. PAMC 26605 TaxID=1112214 RepID=UPI0012F4F798|nr:PilZ domain-containing protein [Sphingomonas sp. PAMC 26605]